MPGTVAILIFVVVVLIWRWVYVKNGNFRFWQVVAAQPEKAFSWVQTRSDWIVLKPRDPQIEQLRNSPQLVGPFELVVPSVGGLVIMFAESASIGASQAEFMRLADSSTQEERIPWVSSLAMLYPMAAMVAAAAMGAPTLSTLGYGFGNLGYLLLVAGIIAGRFRVLGFYQRIPTLIAAIGVWVVGTIICNL